MPRASARLSPASSRSARLAFLSAIERGMMAARAAPAAGITSALHVGPDEAHVAAAAGAGRPGTAPRRATGAAALHAPQRHAQPQVRAADRPLGVAEAPLARAPADRRPLLRRAGRDVRDRPRRGRAARPLV